MSQYSGLAIYPRSMTYKPGSLQVQDPLYHAPKFHIYHWFRFCYIPLSFYRPELFLLLQSLILRGKFDGNDHLFP
jgi:hypothetical protein